MKVTVVAEEGGSRWLDNKIAHSGWTTRWLTGAAALLHAQWNGRREE